MPNPVAPDGAPDDVAARLPISTRITRPPTSAPAVDVAWSFAPLDRTIADAVAERFGVRIGYSDTAANPLEHPAFAALYASARTEQVIRELSARTNLLLAGTTAAVAGDGPLAAHLATALTRIGVRVIRATADPLTELTARLAGLDTSPSTASHYLFVTGERPTARARNRGSSTTRRVDATPLGVSDTIPDSVLAQSGAIMVDVSPAGAPQAATGDAHPRAGVREHGGTRAVEIDAALPRDTAATSALPWRILDALVALSILAVRSEPALGDTTGERDTTGGRDTTGDRGDTTDIDTALARAALAELDGAEAPA